ncbi:MAG: hypothetical protein JWO38_5929 [Gemmataceae bacterium]|nr:hypothetical protein [Gemmataceae bacterium]
MDLSPLLHPDRPWLQTLVADAPEVADAAAALRRAALGSAAVCVVRGQKMRTAARLFDEVAAALQFPPYFGENWDALDECLADLEWLPADQAYVVAILDAASVLDQESAEAVVLFRQILERVAREWSRPVEGPPARPAKMFRVLLQCMPEEAAGVRARWSAESAPEPR